MNYTKMPEKMKELLENREFDFSCLTLLDIKEMFNFWAYRFAKPKKVFSAWQYFIYKNRNDLYIILSNALQRADIAVNIYPKASIENLFKYTNIDNLEVRNFYINAFQVFKSRKEQEKREYSTIENFNVDEYLNKNLSEYYNLMM